MRHYRIRKHVQGTAEIPRLNVFKSHRYIYAQIIDDAKGHTIAAASSLTIAQLKQKANTAAAEAVGKEIAAAAKKKKIKHVVFDRSGYLYHGKIKALAEAARTNGLVF